MSHLADPIGQLTPDGQRIYQQIVGSRGHDYPGLFRTLMHYPELAQRFANLGTLLRFEGVLRPDVCELAILTTARELRVAYIWETHQESAAQAHLSPIAIADLFARKDLATHDPIYSSVEKLVQHFLKPEPIPQGLQVHLIAALGQTAFVQLSVVIGYYRMISGLAIGLEFPLPPGMTNPFIN
jgi:4-carboxymuconolactone decarboxylase